MTIERPPSVEFGEVHGTFGDVLEVVTQDRQSAMRINRSDVQLIGVKLLAQQASAEISINANTRLSVYEKRPHESANNAGCSLLLDLSSATALTLTAETARQLACALLAFSSYENKRSDWLVRVESV